VDSGVLVALADNPALSLFQMFEIIKSEYQGRDKFFPDQSTE